MKMFKIFLLGCGIILIVSFALMLYTSLKVDLYRGYKRDMMKTFRFKKSIDKDIRILANIINKGTNNMPKKVENPYVLSLLSTDLKADGINISSNNIRIEFRGKMGFVGGYSYECDSNQYVLTTYCKHWYNTNMSYSTINGRFDD